jgi:hypothetical protein
MSDAPAVGSIRLYDAVKPDLEAGVYRITSSLEIKLQDGSGAWADANPVPQPQQTCIEIVAPRFALDPGNFQGCFPARDANGAFGDRLPHVVLGRRTLPWERIIDSADHAPWLALLTFQKSELSDNNGTPFWSGKTKDVAKDLGARLGLDEDQQITAIKVKDVATLQAVLPSRSELSSLAHIRQVNLADTELAGADDDGWFAVVTGNRLPLPADDDSAVAYVSCLVSLEGRTDLWQPSADTTLIVLFSWSFTCQGMHKTFEHEVSALDAGPFGAPASTAPDVLDADGNIEVSHTDHDGATSLVPYRGPMLGLAADKPVGSAADDISLAAAWELGRLLGTADGHFLREMLEWHRGAEAQARSVMAAARVLETVASPPGVRPALKGAERVGINDVRRQVAQLILSKPIQRANLWRAHPAAARPRPIGQPPRAAGRKPKKQPEPVARGPRPSFGARLLAARLHDLLAPEVRVALRPGLPSSARALTESTGTSSDKEVPAYCQFTISQFNLLYNIPFPYLVPDARLLPDGAIRFFTLDQTWLDALASGALEQHTTGTREMARVRRAAPRAIAARRHYLPYVRRIVQRRLTLGNVPAAEADDTPVPPIVSGFLLRSSLVADRPGLQVRAWNADVPAGADPSDPALAGKAMGILRLERLSPSVLLALFDGIPRLIWIEEPHHGLQLGVDEDASGTFFVPRRNASGADTGGKATVTFRQNALPGVVNIGQLASDLGAAGSSAALALQLIRPPIRQRFSVTGSS